MRSPGYAARAHAPCGARSRPRKATPARLSTALPRPRALRAPRRAARRAGLRPMRQARGLLHGRAGRRRYGQLLGRWLPLRRRAQLLARDSCRFGGELVCPLLAAEGGFEVVGGDADTVVGDPSLREVVSADLRRAVAGTDLRLPEGALLLGP